MDIILENIICKDYLELGLGTTKLAKKYNVTKDFCKKIIHKRKLMRNQYEPNCVFDIWTEESAYFYGLLMSDGSFRKTKDSREKNKKSDLKNLMYDNHKHNNTNVGQSRHSNIE